MTSRPLDRIILASASPRRAELLRAAGIDFDVRPADVDEAIRPGEAAADYVSRLAEAKRAPFTNTTVTRPCSPQTPRSSSTDGFLENRSTKQTRSGCFG